MPIRHKHTNSIQWYFHFVVAPESVCRWSPSWGSTCKREKFINYLRYVPTVGATKCSEPTGAGCSPYNGSPGADALVRGPLPPWAESFLALECAMAAAILALLGILHSRNTASLTHSCLMVSGEPLTPKLRERCSASVSLRRTNYGNAAPAQKYLQERRSRAFPPHYIPV